MNPIAVVRSAYREKFAVPRQPGIVTADAARIEFLSPYDRPEALTGLEGFSHLWIIFSFHLCQRDQWKPTVRPPRLGGNQRTGVFATRSTYRPNPIGLSVVEFEGIEDAPLSIVVRGADLVDGTPVFDIKPYLPWVDAIPEAQAGFAAEPPAALLEVGYTDEARRQLQWRVEAGLPELERLIEQLLSLDPRPAYRRKEEQGDYGVRLYDFNLRWQMHGRKALVTALEPVDES